MGRTIPVALSIAGFDPDSGAGVIADIRTFNSLGVYGVAVVTVVTAQNTYQGYAVQPLDPKLVIAQLRALKEDMGFDAVKVGMVYTKELVEAISGELSGFDGPIVVDPLVKAKSGIELVSKDALEAMKRKLMPFATLVTPNKFEAEALTGISIQTIADARKAAATISKEYGVEAVLVKGGHLRPCCTDILYFKGRYYEFWSKPSKGCYHGVGCVLSSAITALLAKGYELVEAVKKAKKHVEHAIRYGPPIGKGWCPADPLALLEIDAERYRILTDIVEAVKRLEQASHLVAKYIPEVGMQVAMSLPARYARSPADVAAIPGRIRASGQHLIYKLPPEFGASSHVARAILTMMKFKPDIRAAVNVAYSPELVKAAEKIGYTVSYYDRREEPFELKRVEGATIPWGIRKAVERVGGKTPDIVYHLGDVGKEPMILIFARTASEAVTKLLRILWLLHS